jgi:hypothetical protein
MKHPKSGLFELPDHFARPIDQMTPSGRWAAAGGHRSAMPVDPAPRDRAAPKYSSGGRKDGNSVAAYSPTVTVGAKQVPRAVGTDADHLDDVGLFLLAERVGLGTSASERAADRFSSAWPTSRRPVSSPMPAPRAPQHCSSRARESPPRLRDALLLELAESSLRASSGRVSTTPI